MIINTNKGFFKNLTPNFWEETPYFTYDKTHAKRFKNILEAEHMKYILESEFNIKPVKIIDG